MLRLLLSLVRRRGMRGVLAALGLVGALALWWWRTRRARGAVDAAMLRRIEAQRDARLARQGGTRGQEDEANARLDRAERDLAAAEAARAAVIAAVETDLSPEALRERERKAGLRP